MYQSGWKCILIAILLTVICWLLRNEGWAACVIGVLAFVYVIFFVIACLIGTYHVDSKLKKMMSMEEKRRRKASAAVRVAAPSTHASSVDDVEANLKGVKKR